jgi:uncharacterized protein YcbK (DUF882 family)
MPRGGALRLKLRSFALLPLPLAASLHWLASTRRLVAFSPSRLVAFTAAVILASAVPAADAATQRHKHPRLHAMQHMLANVGLPDLGILAGDDDEIPEEGKKYELKLARQGGEILDVVYRVGDTYVPEALDKLSAFLHDTHNQDVKAYDPRTFDVLHTVLAKLDRSNSVIEVLSGYRTKETNDALRASGTSNAAEHSQHIEAKALDIRVLGIPAIALRDAALSLAAGGVGYYPKSQFIHVDTGDVREWTFSPHPATHARRRHRG